MITKRMQDLDELIDRIFYFDHSFMYSDDSSVRSRGYASRDLLQRKVRESDLNQDEVNYITNVIKAKFRYQFDKSWILVEKSEPLAVIKFSIDGLLFDARN